MQTIRKKQILSTAITVLASTLLVAGVVLATTTISTDITTDGSLTVGTNVAVTGNTTLTGALVANGGIVVDTDNFLINGTTGALVVQSSATSGSLGLITLDAAAMTAQTTGLTIDMSPITGGAFDETGLAIIGDADGSANALGIALDGAMDYGINMAEATINTADIVLQNSETIINTTDGIIALGGEVQINGVRRSNVSGYEYFLNVTGDLTGSTSEGGTPGTGSKTRVILVEADRQSGVPVEVGDIEDVGMKIVIGNAADNSASGTGYVLRGIDAQAKNRETGNITNVYGGLISFQTDSGSTTSTAKALEINSTANGTINDLMIVADIRHFRQAATEPTVEYTLRVRNSSTSGSGADAGIYLESDYASLTAPDSFDYGIDMNAATINTADIRLSNGATIANTSADVLTITETEINVVGYLTSDNNGSAIDAAGGRTMITGYYLGGTTALTGDGIGVYGNARVDVDSSSGKVIGGYFKAGNGSGDTGYNIDVIRGVYVEGVKKAGTAAIDAARGVEISMDWDAATTTTTTLTGLRVELQTGATASAPTHSAGIHVTNQSVSGVGQKMGSAILVTQLSCGSGEGFDFGLDLGDSSFVDDGLTFTSNTFGTADIRLSSGAMIFTGSAANGDAVFAEVGAKDAKGSIYISTAAGAIYVQVADAGAATDWFKVTSSDAD
jgi:hypothetical protein